MAFDIFKEIERSNFLREGLIPQEEFEADYIKNLNEFICPKTDIKF